MKLRFDNCPNCFAKLDGRAVCGNCGTNINQIKEYSSALEVFTLMNNKYLLGKVLGKGGFGITYLAQNIENGRLCCIKEYMPSDYAGRCRDGVRLEPLERGYRNIYEHGKKRFIDEARTLVKLNNNRIVVDILDYFQANNTAYFVMEYLDGKSMKSLTKEQGGRLSKDIAGRILAVIGSALVDVHSKGILHRDISPENIFITRNNEIKLIDFGAARDYIMSQNTGMSVVLKTGYAPPEQYSSSGKQGPWTDIYALAATYYTSVSGEKLLDSMFVLKGMKQRELFELNCGIDKHTSDVIAKAMAVNYRDRYQDMSEFLNDLNIKGTLNDNYIQSDMVQTSVNGAGNIQASRTADTIYKKSEIPEKSFTASNYTGNENSVRFSDGGKMEIRRTVELKPKIEAIINSTTMKSMQINNDMIVRVGRSGRESDFIINGDTIISRLHVLIAYEKGTRKFAVTDKSSNGTYLKNGKRLIKDKTIYVDSGTEIYLSNQKYVIRLLTE